MNYTQCPYRKKVEKYRTNISEIIMMAVNVITFMVTVQRF